MCAAAECIDPWLGAGVRPLESPAAREVEGIGAALRGAEFISPDDVKEVLPAVISHRLVLAPEAMLEGATTQGIVQRLLEQVPVPR